MLGHRPQDTGILYTPLLVHSKTLLLYNSLCVFACSLVVVVVHVRVSQTSSQAYTRLTKAVTWSQDHNWDLKLEALKGQCHETFHLFLSKNSTWAPYEQAKTVVSAKSLTTRTWQWLRGHGRIFWMPLTAVNGTISQNKKQVPGCVNKSSSTFFNIWKLGVVPKAKIALTTRTNEFRGL